jgi:hypothetical protein
MAASTLKTCNAPQPEIARLRVDNSVSFPPRDCFGSKFNTFMLKQWLNFGGLQAVAHYRHIAGTVRESHAWREVGLVRLHAEVHRHRADAGYFQAVGARVVV